MNLSTQIAGLQLEHPVMNAAGTCKTLEDVKKIAPSATAAIVVGSITYNKRDGNRGNTYWESPQYSLNSIGMANGGYVYYETCLKEMVDIAHSYNKPLIVSIAGFNSEEYARLAKLCFDSGVDAIEANLSCPNVWHGTNQKRIACFSKESIIDICAHITKVIGDTYPLMLKVSPFSDPYALEDFAYIFKVLRFVSAVTTSNTFPNALAYHGDVPVINTNQHGYAGLSGEAMRPIALGQVSQLKEYLPMHIKIIGVGGISNGSHVVEYQHAGAHAVQIATSYFKFGEAIFHTLLQELLQKEG